VLLNKKILVSSSLFYNYYIAGIGAGTMLGFAVFIYGGSHMVSGIATHQGLLNIVIGTILLLTALIQVRKMVTIPVFVPYNGAGNRMK
jgi:hypothetical protein